MAPAPVPAPFKELGFTRLSSVAFIYQPSISYGTTIGSTNSSTPPPDLILFPSWMDAQPRHVSKYLAEYQKLYPTSTIITINFQTAHSLRLSKSNQTKWYGPVVDYVVSLPKGTKILLHQVSNGGSFCIISIASLYHSLTNNPLPLTAQVLDSTPGQPSFFSDIDSVLTGMPPNPVVRAVAWSLIFIFSSISYAVLFVMRREHMVNVMRGKLNAEGLFERCPRAYIFSRQDKMVAAEAVELHVKESRALGWKCTAEEFKGSKHVAHMMLDRERYWGIVEDVWKEGCTAA